MTPAARVAAAIEVLDRVFAGTAAEQALTGWARGARYAGSKDRAAVRDHVFQALRCKRSYAALGGGTDGRAVMIGALKVQGGDLTAIFSGEGHAPYPLTSEEKDAGHPPEEGAEAHDLPDWLWAAFSTSLGDQASSAAMALRDRAPVALRVNLRAAALAEAEEALRADGIEAQPTDLVETGLIVTEGARRINGSRAYNTGMVELQDASSQVAMAALTIPDDARVLDYCAGGGGKVLALAAQATGRWFAHDAAPQRMRDLPARAERAGVQVSCLEPGQLAEHGPYDLVLTDVPCTGSGTWRRAPDAKWRLTEVRLDELCKIQADILDQAAALVAPGGELAYTTCSVLRQENEDQIAGFLARHPEWQQVEATRWPISAEGDGFYLSRLARK